MRGVLGSTAMIVALGAIGIAHAQSAAIEITLDPPPRLVVGDRAEVVARVRASEHAGAPMLITPSSEGSAVEVVRGRLLRGDAEDPSAEELRFRVPLVARTAGTAVVRVRVDGFECEAGRCTPLVVETSVALEVLPAPAR